MKNRNSTMITIIIVTIFVLIGLYIGVFSKIKMTYVPSYEIDDYMEFPEKKVGVNEYKVINVTEEEMIRTYFNAFATALVEDLDKAYSRLDEDVVIEDYPNVLKFRGKASLLTNGFQIVPKFSEYYVTSDDEGTIIYKVRDRRGNIYNFKVEAVMKFTVSFD